MVESGYRMLSEKIEEINPISMNPDQSYLLGLMLKQNHYGHQNIKIFHPNTQYNVTDIPKSNRYYGVTSVMLIHHDLIHRSRVNPVTMKTEDRYSVVTP